MRNMRINFFSSLVTRDSNLNSLRWVPASWVRELKSKIKILLDREAWMWSQHFRVLWLAYGDSNTKFFHMKVTERYRKKFIERIRDTTETW